MTAVNESLDAVQAYFDAWNSREPAAIAASLGEWGRYSDPAGADLGGPAVAAYAAGLFAAFPDLRFELGPRRQAGDDMLVVQWMMRGTNTGSLGGLPPTNATIALPGVDLIALRDNRIATVHGYFDRQQLMEQLGAQVVIQPQRLGPAIFGTSTRTESTAHGTPGAMSLTMLETRSDEEALRVRTMARAMLPEIVAMRGFLGMTTVVVGRRFYTMTAWRAADDPHQLRAGSHAAAMRPVFGGEIGQAGLTGIWTPAYLVARVRCGACAQWQRTQGAGSLCQCGAVLPDPPALW